MVDVGPFCIDRHEATNAEYKQFLDAVGTPAPGSQPTGCEFNASFHPNEHCSTGFDVQNKPDYAVYCVDWCDAYAYCKWAGKHLCGNIGGGPLNDQNFEDYSVSQWGYACSNGGQTNYPYGDTSQVGTCAIGVDEGAVETHPVCRGLVSPFDQVYDMVGRPSEWIDYCDPIYGCMLMGHLAQPAVMTSSCKANKFEGKHSGTYDTAIRCCL